MYQQPEQQTESNFIKKQNKAKLWNCLQNNGTFNNIDNVFFTKVREDFELTIQHIEKENSQKSTIEKSKLFIDSMLKNVKNYKHPPNINHGDETDTNIQTQSVSEEPTQKNDLPYTSESIKQTRMNAFDNALNQKQNEFNQFNSKPQTPSVDFLDKDTDNGDDVNKLLENAMRERENLNVSINENKQDPHTSPISGTVSTNTTSLANIINAEQNVNSYPQEEMLLKIYEKLTKIEAYLKEGKETKNEDLS